MFLAKRRHAGFIDEVKLTYLGWQAQKRGSNARSIAPLTSAIDKFMYFRVSLLIREQRRETLAGGASSSTGRFAGIY
jgi:hypothetical protein